MTLDELRAEIETRAGIPATLIHGETAEEVIAQAKALNAYRRDHEQVREKSNAEQFQNLFNTALGIEQPDTIATAFAEIEDIARAGDLYPKLCDGGELYGEKANMGDPRPHAEQFAEWFRNKTAFDPFKRDGWTRLF